MPRDPPPCARPAESRGARGERKWQELRARGGGARLPRQASSSAWHAWQWRWRPLSSPPRRWRDARAASRVPAAPTRHTYNRLSHTTHACTPCEVITAHLIRRGALLGHRGGARTGPAHATVTVRQLPLQSGHPQAPAAEEVLVQSTGSEGTQRAQATEPAQVEAPLYAASKAAPTGRDRTRTQHPPPFPFG
eukprot:COSAG02_NODE_4508_length_5281_cov_2.226939_4_plen_192_part_00